MMPSSFLPCPASLSLRLLDVRADWAEIVHTLMVAQDRVPALHGCLIEAENGDAVRIGGTDLHGDLYLRLVMDRDGARAELASRRGDAAIRDAVLGDLGERVAAREPDDRRLSEPTLAEVLAQPADHLRLMDSLHVASAAIDAAHASRVRCLEPLLARLNRLGMPARMRARVTTASDSPRRALVGGTPVALDHVIEHACPWTDRWVRLHLRELSDKPKPGESLLQEVEREILGRSDEGWIIGWVEAG